MQENLVVKKATPLGARVWASLLVFGFIGQIAWMVENVYFSTYIQKNITAAGWATSATVAASAIAALQEASGKGSRDSSLSAYRAYTELVNLSIELIRQFYDMPRKFRIVGQYGMQQYITYDNSGLKPQVQLSMVEGMGDRLPVFDIKVSAQKKNVYTKVSQNELALQFFQMGFFNPQLTDQALMCLDMMEFDGKDGVMQKVSQSGTMFQKLTQRRSVPLWRTPEHAAMTAPSRTAGP